MAMGSPSSQTTLSEINVTPLVDVMLVLLIIFMVTAPMMQQGIDVKLPETAPSGIETQENPFVVVIKRDSRIFLGKNPIVMSKLQNKLKAIFEARQKKEIYVQADREVPYGVVAEALAEIRAAGIFGIGLVTLPKTE